MTTYECAIDEISWLVSFKLNIWCRVYRCKFRYLRPRKLDTDSIPKKTYKSTKTSVLTQTRRMFLGNSRPSFVHTTRASRRWFLTTEAVLGGLLFALLVASIGFTVLISVRFNETKQVMWKLCLKSVRLIMFRILLTESTSLWSSRGNNVTNKV